MLSSVCRLAGLDVAAVLACTATAARSRNVKVDVINRDALPEFCQPVSTTMRAAAAQREIDVKMRESKGEERVIDQVALV